MRYFLDRTLERIEREGNDDLLLVHTLGPQHFSTPDLYDMLEQLEAQKELVARKLSNLYRMGSLIPVFVIATFLASYFKITWLGILFLSAVPILGILFSIRTVRIRRDHPTYYDSQIIEYKIRQELRRRQESSIF